MIPNFWFSFACWQATCNYDLYDPGHHTNEGPFWEAHGVVTDDCFIWSGSLRMEKGYQRCESCQSIEDENRLFLLEEWDTQENFKDHMKSRRFKVFRGGDEPSQRALWNYVPHRFSPVGDGGDLIEDRRHLSHYHWYSRVGSVIGLRIFYCRKIII